MISERMIIPDLGVFSLHDGLIPLAASSDGLHRTGENGVTTIAATGDRKVELIAFADRTLAYVQSLLGYPAYYPIQPVELRTPVRAVLMDLDGVSVHSEDFWVWIIQLTTASLLDNPHFELEDADLPFVSGHSVSEHLSHCLAKYCPDRTVEQARAIYFDHARRQMQAVLEGQGRADAFHPAPGLKDFLLTLRAREVKIALVTSGLHEKAYPAIAAVFRQLNLGRPEDFYDAIITAGFPLGRGMVGTLGELEAKPHPWLYAEALRVGLGMTFEERHWAVGIEDSGAGVCAVRLAGLNTVGIGGGNVIQSGTQAFCGFYRERLEDVLSMLF